MIYFNIRRVLNQKGIVNHSALLQSIGIKGYVVRRLLRINPMRIDLSLLWTLCKELNCTPNDLLSIPPTSSENLSPHHAMKGLIRDQEPPHISRRLVNLPLDKLAEVQALVNKLSEESK